MSVINLKESDFEEVVLKSSKPVLLDFYADWCGPCKIMSPIVDEIAEENADKIVACKVNVDENQELASKYDIMSIPTIIIFKDGEVAKKFVGVTAKSDIVESL